MVSGGYFLRKFSVFLSRHRDAPRRTEIHRENFSLLSKNFVNLCVSFVNLYVPKKLGKQLQECDDERRSQQQAVKAVQKTTVSRNTASGVFDSNTALEQ